MSSPLIEPHFEYNPMWVKFEYNLATKPILKNRASGCIEADTVSKGEQLIKTISQLIHFDKTPFKPLPSCKEFIGALAIQMLLKLGKYIDNIRTFCVLTYSYIDIYCLFVRTNKRNPVLNLKIFIDFVSISTNMILKPPPSHKESIGILDF